MELMEKMALLLLRLRVDDKGNVAWMMCFGLVPEIESYKDCSGGWKQYISGSLFTLVTTGKGKPELKSK